MKRITVVAAAALILLAFAPARALAGSIQTPSGLAAGAQFRLMYVSGAAATHDATSDDIAVYDAFAEFVALIDGLTLYNGSPVVWHALVSTPTVDARDGLPNSLIPIYECDPLGIFLCDSFDLLFDATHDIWSGLGGGGPGTTADGGEWTGAVWTGTFLDGTAEDPMGGDTATFGRARFGAGFWLCCGFAASSNMLPIYMYSDVITVASTTGGGGGSGAVPEASTMALLLAGLALLCVWRVLKSRGLGQKRGQWS